MRYRFIGQYTGGRSTIDACGVTFEGREPSEVVGEDALRRLASNPEFEAVADTPKAKPKRTRKA